MGIKPSSQMAKKFLEENKTNMMKDASMVREGLLEVVTLRDQRGDCSR